MLMCVQITVVLSLSFQPSVALTDFRLSSSLCRNIFRIYLPTTNRFGNGHANKAIAVPSPQILLLSAKSLASLNRYIEHICDFATR